MKEIRNNLIAIIVFKNDWKNFLLYLEVDKNNNIQFKMKKEIPYSLNEDKNSIKKLTDDYFLILLKESGFIIINSNNKEIFLKYFNNISSSLLYGEIKVFEDYFYNYILEKTIGNEFIFKQSKSKICELSQQKVEIKYGKHFLLKINDKINIIGLLFEKKEEKNNNVINCDNKTEKFNTKVIIVAGDNNILIFNYYP